tara:strand:- start:9 stop:308 length:300 start_codon:yes stop_codon:yes gene_type:complete
MFYWSFYDLIKKKVIVLNNTEYWENDKLVGNDFSFTYGSSELKSGKIIKYESGYAEPNDANAMSKEFFDYFELIPPVKDLKVLDHPTKDKKVYCRIFIV